MPQVIADVTSSAIGDRTANFTRAESGRLVCLSALVPAQDVEPNTIYARLSVVDASAQPPNIIAALAAGYIGGAQAINWTGDLQLFSACAVMIETWGNSIATCRLTGIITINPTT
jgi:hypothetical protein